MSEESHNMLAQPVAPEDIREGDYLAVLSVISEYLPLGPLFDLTFNIPRSMEPVRVQWLPCGESVPLKVEAVCLPFVLVKSPQPPARPAFSVFGPPAGADRATVLRTLDVRRHRLARLPEEYGKRVYRLLKARAASVRGGAPSADEDC